MGAASAFSSTRSSENDRCGAARVGGEWSFCRRFLSPALLAFLVSFLFFSVPKRDKGKILLLHVRCVGEEKKKEETRPKSSWESCLRKPLVHSIALERGY